MLVKLTQLSLLLLYPLYPNWPARKKMLCMFEKSVHVQKFAKAQIASLFLSSQLSLSVSFVQAVEVFILLLHLAIKCSFFIALFEHVICAPIKIILLNSLEALQKSLSIILIRNNENFELEQKLSLTSPSLTYDHLTYCFLVND